MKILTIVLFLLPLLQNCVYYKLYSAQNYIENQEYLKAKEEIEIELEMNPYNPEGWYLLGFVEGELGNIDKMLSAYTRSQLNGSDFNKEIESSKENYWQKEYSEGIEEYRDSNFSNASLHFANALKIKPNESNTKEYYYSTLNKIGDNTSTNHFTVFKDIEGFQNFKWGLSPDSVKSLLFLNSYDLKDNRDGFISILVTDFVFQNKTTILNLEFYNQKLYKVAISLLFESNVIGLTRYFSIADMVQEVYGFAKRIPIGHEADDFNSIPLQISNGNLRYYYQWIKPSGELLLTLKNFDSDKFICIFLYSSHNASEIDSDALKNEF